MEPRDRMEVLYRFGRLIEENVAEFALLDTLDMGKPISDMINSDVPGSALTFQFFAEAIDKLEGRSGARGRSMLRTKSRSATDPQ
jgi:gamma-glutamyl-gamma-aminobutyraldehyde dehydrogenase